MSVSAFQCTKYFCSKTRFDKNNEPNVLKIGIFVVKTAKMGKVMYIVHNFPHFNVLITSHLIRPRCWDFHGCVHCIVALLRSKFGVNCTKILGWGKLCTCT